MREILNFNKGWKFSHEEMNFEHRPEGVDIDLPHTWNGVDGQDGGADYYRGVGYYAKEFELSELPKTDLRYLEITGANSSCEIFLNGKKIGEHDGGYSTYRVELSVLKEHNLLIIKVDNSENEKIYPQFADFTFYGGLYRSVNVIGVSFEHFDLEFHGGPGIRINTEICGKNAVAEIEVYLKKGAAEGELIFEIFDDNGIPVSRKTQSTGERMAKLDVKDVRLWQGRADPYLYDVEVSLFCDGKCKDKITSKIGFREFFVDSEEGFFLNGQKYSLRGVSRHQDRPKIGNALLREHHEEDIALILELGANAVRLAHYQHDEYFYSLCDRYGLVVWAEIPYISRHMPTARENTVLQMTELIIQNYNHPSICFWGVSNEITLGGGGDDLLDNHILLNGLCHSLDSTRKTTLAAVSMCDKNDPYLRTTDLIAYNHYFGWYGGDVSMNAEWFDEFHKEFPERAIGLSEYGAEALNWHSSEPTQGDYTEEYQAYYHEKMIEMIDARPYLWCTFVWNMFDFAADARREGGEDGMNHKGLVSFDRKYKKDAFYAYKAWLSGEPFVHIAGKRYKEREGDKIKIKVYSNMPEIELIVNGKSVEKKCGKRVFEFEIQNGKELHVLAEGGGVYDEADFIGVSEYQEKYRLRDKHAILNWFDIKAPEGKLSINDKISDIVATKKGRVLFELHMSGIDSKNAMGGIELNEGIFKMLGAFSFLRFAGLSESMGKKFTKEELLRINEELNKIDKEEKSE